MATLDWSQCPAVESVPGRLSDPLFMEYADSLTVAGAVVSTACARTSDGRTIPAAEAIPRNQCLAPDVIEAPRPPLSRNR